MTIIKGKSKAISLQPCTGPEGFSRLSFHISRQSTNECGKEVSLTHQLHLAKDIFLVLISVRV